MALFKLTPPSSVTFSNIPGQIEKLHTIWDWEELLWQSTLTSCITQVTEPCITISAPHL